MTHKLKLIAAASVSAVIAGQASAQDSTFANDGAADAAVEALEESIANDADRDLSAFGNQGRAIGTFGSVSARATVTNDDGSTGSDVGVGLRYGSFDGLNGYDVSLSYNYGEDDGVETDNNLLAGVDYRRDLSDVLFAFAKADLAFDRTADMVGDFSQDIFVGAGAGYRIINNGQTQWSVQAGPGYRVSEVVGSDDVSEAAAGVSSNYFQSLSQTSYITNDTDILYSDAGTVVNNELAINVSMTNALSLRTGLTTQYNDASDDSFSDARNTLGVSVVYNFN